MGSDPWWEKTQGARKESTADQSAQPMELKPQESASPDARLVSDAYSRYEDDPSQLQLRLSQIRDEIRQLGGTPGVDSKAKSETSDLTPKQLLPNDKQSVCSRTQGGNPIENDGGKTAYFGGQMLFYGLLIVAFLMGQCGGPSSGRYDDWRDEIPRTDDRR